MPTSVPADYGQPSNNSDENVIFNNQVIQRDVFLQNMVNTAFHQRMASSGTNVQYPGTLLQGMRSNISANEMSTTPNNHTGELEVIDLCDEQSQPEVHPSTSNSNQNNWMQAPSPHNTSGNDNVVVAQRQHPSQPPMCIHELKNSTTVKSNDGNDYLGAATSSTTATLSAPGGSFSKIHMNSNNIQAPYSVQHIQENSFSSTFGPLMNVNAVNNGTSVKKELSLNAFGMPTKRNVSGNVNVNSYVNPTNTTETNRSSSSKPPVLINNSTSRPHPSVVSNMQNTRSPLGGSGQYSSKQSSNSNAADRIQTNTTTLPRQAHVARNSPGKAPSSSGVNQKRKPDFTPSQPLCDPSLTKFVKLDNVPEVTPLLSLNPAQIHELETMLQFTDENNNRIDGWKDDWGGNLQLLEKEIITNRDKLSESPHIKPITKVFKEVVCSKAKGGNAGAFRGILLLFSFVYHLKDTPKMAKKLLAYSLVKHVENALGRAEFIAACIRRISYDPTVLQEDGWTTVKAEKPEGATGGAYLIGRRVIWSCFEAVVIAFVRDDGLGDLWKAMWIEDLETFDLEADEIQDAMRKYDAKIARKKAKLEKKMSSSGSSSISASKDSSIESKKPSNSSTRFSATINFTVENIEHGIILATSYDENARYGVLWPARVLHVSELNAFSKSGLTSKRSSQKNNVPVMFLAPYWNGGATKVKYENYEKAKRMFSSGPLFALENIEVSNKNIQKYPYGADSDSLSIDKLRDSFRFLGLPKAAFSRYVDSHRLAQSLKHYARCHLSETSHASNASAALTETHVLSVQTAMFPNIVLNLPYDYMLSKLPHPDQQLSQVSRDDTEEDCEPVLQLAFITKTMTPPMCWGKGIPNHETKSGIPKNHESSMLGTPTKSRPFTPVTSPEARESMSISCLKSGNAGKVTESHWSVTDFASEYLLAFLEHENHAENTSVSCLSLQLTNLVKRLCRDMSAAPSKNTSERKSMLNSISNHCLLVKAHGEDAFYAQQFGDQYNIENIVRQWRKACEKIYKCACVKLSSEGLGNNVTSVITDTRCNQHLTAAGSFERAVRLPAAIKGAKNAGAGKSKNIPLITQVNQSYMEIAENKVVPRAHKAPYLKRIKARVSELPPDAKGAPLTDDSEGEGGEDTMGSRGSYTAAVTGVAAALQAVDMVIRGDCVNAFCATRPPGHHAGKELHAMNAISNGFCLLNGAACAALYATLSRAEGGCGLKRVCVIDFDVHHGNGTQDILCSTYDSRFFYVSIHAGGAHVNGYENDTPNNDEAGSRQSLGVGSKQPQGIFPGKCGDTSPHPGVLNIPLGRKVTAHAVGNALVTKVGPAVERFSPDLIILSAGFDAHKNDPLGMGGLSADDFGSITEIACQFATKSCSGRVISLLEGGYGVPCCRPQKDLFLPPSNPPNVKPDNAPNPTANLKILDLGDDLPPSMNDEMEASLMQTLDKCHAEGFLECIQKHVGSLVHSNKRSFINP